MIENPERWINKELATTGFILKEIVGHGKIGYVFRAEHKLVPRKLRAYKLIAADELKHGWENEVTKVSALEAVPEIAAIQDWGTGLDDALRPFVYIGYTFVKGVNLRDFLFNAVPNFAVVQAVLGAILRVYHACSRMEIQHGDLHPGNILISDPNPLIPGNERKIVITDFGYGGSNNNTQPKNDVLQISHIAKTLFGKINFSELESNERLICERLKIFFRKDFLDTIEIANQGSEVNKASAYLAYTEAIEEAKKSAVAISRSETVHSVADYLNAETLGFRPTEWRDLFVPRLLGSDAFTSRNVTVITGARGCGKTMAFRRLTAYMDELIGSPSGVPGSTDFVGFYLNCRDLIEAFPFLPRKLSVSRGKQLLHYFHLCWLQDAMRTFHRHSLRGDEEFEWFAVWLERRLERRIEGRDISGVDLGTILLAFLEGEKVACASLQSNNKDLAWPLWPVSILDDFYEVANRNISWIKGRPFYLFLDDYTIPLITAPIQAVLNTVIFKRRSNIIFKISTEATNSFLREANSKALEINHDFDLVDLASETLYVDEGEKSLMLQEIFLRRMERVEGLKGRNLSLRDVLGEEKWPSFNELARKLREKKGTSGDILYSGHRTFVGIWSSDIRSLIQIFNELIRYAGGDGEYRFPVDPELQQGRLSESGGEFLNVVDTIKLPGYWHGNLVKAPPKNAGSRLKKIAQAFIYAARSELIEGPEINNQGLVVPRQAFRIEIVDEFDLSDEAAHLYFSLLRWHVFLPDWRGRSVRGKMVPRLFLNRRLIPYARLSFSQHDSISLTNAEFSMLLLEPKGFERYWRQKMKKRTRDGGGNQLGLPHV